MTDNNHDSLALPAAESPRPRARFDRFWLIILLVPPFLIFPNLDASILWQDEAECALLGRRIFEFGFPLADDGRGPIDPTGHSVHIVSDQVGFIDINEEGIWTWTSWLGNYTCAASFILFSWLGGDQSTFAARFPFAVVGWVVFAVMYAGLRDITRDRTLSRVAVLLLMFSVPYLLFTRQCRSYTLLALFTFLQTWGYIRLIRGQGKALPMFIIGGVGSYYSFFVQMVGATAAMGMHLLLRHRRWALLWRFAAGCVLVGAFTGPFFIYTRSWDRDYAGSGFPATELWRFVSSLRAYIIHVQSSAWPFLLLFPLACGTGFPACRRPAGKPVPHGTQPGHGPWRRRLVAIAVTLFTTVAAWSLTFEASRASYTTILVLTGLTVLIGVGWVAITPGGSAVAAANGEAVNWRYVVGMVLGGSVLIVAALANHPFFRYLVGLTPWFALATAACVLRATRRRWWAVLPVTLVLIGTEFLHYGPIYIARRLALDPRRQELAIQIGDDRAHLALNDFGNLAANGYTWTMLYKDGRRDFQNPRRELEFPLYNYAYELTHDYRGPIEAVITYLDEHAEPNETIITVYEHFPLKFYTQLQVFRPRETFTRLWDLPDWIVRQHQGYLGGLHPRIKKERYDQVNDEDLGYPCMLMWDNIPEPPWHFFRTVTGRSPVKLWRLKEQFKARRGVDKFPDTLTVP